MQKLLLDLLFTLQDWAVIITPLLPCPIFFGLYPLRPASTASVWQLALAASLNLDSGAAGSCSIGS